MTETVDSLKQRLVGAIVIIVLAIIFLPMIFDKPHQEGSVVITPVPPKPEFRTIEISKPERPVFEALKVDPSDEKVKRESQLVENSESNSKSSSLSQAKTETSKSAPNKSASNKTTSGKAKAEVQSATVNNSTSKVAKKETPPKRTVSTETKKNNSPSVSSLPMFKNIWMVQLGTFGNVNNAYRLRDKLRKDGFDGHTKSIQLNGKTAIKVFTGPFVKKREALKAKKRLDKKYKVESRIVFFDA